MLLFNSFLIVLLVFSLWTSCYEVQCPVGSGFRPKIAFQISDRELLVNTLYKGVNVIVDSKDKLVSS